jgi:hypothetical protein
VEQMNTKTKMYGVMLIFIILSTASFFLGYNNGIHNGRVRQCKDMDQVLVYLDNIGEEPRMTCMSLEQFKKLSDFDNNMKHIKIDFDIDNIGGK